MEYLSPITIVLILIILPAVYVFRNNIMAYFKGMTYLEYLDYEKSRLDEELKDVERKQDSIWKIG